MKKIVTFAEVMGRLESLNNKRLVQSLPGTLEWTFGGAEANVAASLSYMGKRNALRYGVARNPLGEACLRFLRSFGID